MVRITLLAVALLSTVAGCKKQLPIDAPMTAEAVVPTPVTPAAVPDAVVQTLLRNFERVHFEFDSAVLDDGSMNALAGNAQILQEYPRIRVEVQGHCDERGTVDYNMALGNRRASAVTNYLTKMGVSSSRLELLSYGEEVPLSGQKDEVAWSQNRRAEFRLLTTTDGVAGSTR